VFTDPAPESDIGGKPLAGVGEEAYLSWAPGFAGRIDFWKGGKLVRLVDDVPHRLSPDDLRRFVVLARAVAARV